MLAKTDGQPVRDAIIKSHTHTCIVQTPESVGAFVDLAESVGNDKMQDIFARRLVALGIDNSRVLERGRHRGNDEWGDFNSIQQALRLSCLLK